MSDALQEIIDGLKEMAHAPRQNWQGIARKITDSGRLLTADAGIHAVNLCSAAKILAPTFHFVDPSTEQEVRGTCQSLALMLERERAVHGPKPHYARDN